MLPMTSEKLAKRYSDGYRAANWISRTGAVIKSLGLILAALFWLLAGGAGLDLIENQAAEAWIKNVFQLSLHQQEKIILIWPLVPAFVICFVLEVIGTLLAAVGQVVRATFDTAVNTSPFLSTLDKAKVLQTPTTLWEEIKESWTKA
jgi:hypothetical protein